MISQNQTLLQSGNFTNTFEIKKVPTFVYYKNGKICNSLIGINKGNIEELVNEYL